MKLHEAIHDLRSAYKSAQQRSGSPTHCLVSLESLARVLGAFDTRAERDIQQRATSDCQYKGTDTCELGCPYGKRTAEKYCAFDIRLHRMQLPQP